MYMVRLKIQQTKIVYISFVENQIQSKSLKLRKIKFEFVNNNNGSIIFILLHYAYLLRYIVNNSVFLYSKLLICLLQRMYLL